MVAQHVFSLQLLRRRSSWSCTRSSVERSTSSRNKMHYSFRQK